MQRKLIFVLSFLLPILCLGASGDHTGSLHLDGSIENIIGEHAGNIFAILGEGEATSYLGDQWIGTLQEFNLESGYWLRVNDPSVVLSDRGIGFDPRRDCNIFVASIGNWCSLYPKTKRCGSKDLFGSSKR